MKTLIVIYGLNHEAIDGKTKKKQNNKKRPSASFNLETMGRKYAYS